MDPGAPGATAGKPQTDFVGLEEPPAARADEPGRTFKLTSPRIGSLASGSPVFFHDIDAGEVLGYDLAKDGKSVTIQVFVRKPYDDFVHQDTRFWDSSGVTVKLGAQGVQLQVQSLQAVLSGGVAFDSPGDNPSTGRGQGRHRLPAIPQRGGREFGELCRAAEIRDLCGRLGRRARGSVRRSTCSASRSAT